MGLRGQIIKNQLSGLKPTGAMEHLTVSTSPVTATAIEDNVAEFALVSVDGEDVRVTFDGTAPSASNGHLLEDAYKEVWSREQVNAAKFIRNAGTDASVVITPMD